MADSWVSRGVVWLDGKWYYIREVCNTDCFEPGTRFVELDLVVMHPEEDDVED